MKACLSGQQVGMPKPGESQECAESSSTTICMHTARIACKAWTFQTNSWQLSCLGGGVVLKHRNSSSNSLLIVLARTYALGRAPAGGGRSDCDRSTISKHDCICPVVWPHSKLTVILFAIMRRSYGVVSRASEPALLDRMRGRWHAQQSGIQCGVTKSAHDYTYMHMHFHDGKTLYTAG